MIGAGRLEGDARDPARQLVREKASHAQRIQKTLEDANIKLDSVISDLLGPSGRAMVEAPIAGETDPAALAALSRRLKAPEGRAPGGPAGTGDTGPD